MSPEPALDRTMTPDRLVGAADPARAMRFAANLARELHADLPLYACVLAYLQAACAFGAVVGAPQKFVPLLYLGVWLRYLGAVLFIWFLLLHVAPAVATRPAAPLTAALESARRSLTPRAAAGGVLFCAVAVFFGAFTSVKNMLPDLAVFAWDTALADLDAWLHGGAHPWRLLQPALSGPAATRAVEILYAPVWFAALAGACAWAATTARHAHLRVRFFLAFFLAWVLLGNAAAGLFMSAGPAFYGEVTGDHARFAGLLSGLAAGADMPHSAYAIQRMLWRLHEAGEVRLGTGISAFPSLHLAMATLIALFLWAVDRRLGVLGAAFLAAIQAGSVHLGWHYAVDGYFSIAATLALWRFAGVLADGRARIAAPTPAKAPAGASWMSAWTATRPTTG